MSEADRYRRDKARQGKLTKDQWAQPESDCFQLLDGKNYPKSNTDVEDGLIRFCGWDPCKIKGPKAYMHQCLVSLEEEGLVESQFELKSAGIDAWIEHYWWRKSEETKA